MKIAPKGAIPSTLRTTDLEPGSGESDKDVESKNQAASATEIPKTSSE